MRVIKPMAKNDSETGGSSIKPEKLKRSFLCILYFKFKVIGAFCQEKSQMLSNMLSIIYEVTNIVLGDKIPTTKSEKEVKNYFEVLNYEPHTLQVI